ncbi:hypothetical protein N3Z16_10095 (plasmid) [Candidatus Megaera polyxenophila]|nr:hypothetical protein N3Z16_10095 [Candidatus Megaera polyxenophila]
MNLQVSYELRAAEDAQKMLPEIINCGYPILSIPVFPKYAIC